MRTIRVLLSALTIGFVFFYETLTIYGQNPYLEEILTIDMLDEGIRKRTPNYFIGELLNNGFSLITKSDEESTFAWNYNSETEEASCWVHIFVFETGMAFEIVNGSNNPFYKQLNEQIKERYSYRGVKPGSVKEIEYYSKSYEVDDNIEMETFSVKGSYYINAMHYFRE